jgi:transcriptional regulator with XRE-family HTH domain
MRRKDSSRRTKPVDGLSHWISDRTNFGLMNITQQPDAFTRPFPSNIEIGRRMRAARKKRGWTIAEMAEIGKIKAVVIGSYERGSRNMPISRLGEIARILGVDVAYLLGQPMGRQDSSLVLTLDLRAISRPSFTNPDRLALVVSYCAGIVKKRSDWNGEVLSIRESDLLNLSFAMGIEHADLLQWLTVEHYLLTEINHS